MINILKLAKPKTAIAITNKLRNACLVSAIVCGITALTWGALFAPPDYLQGDAVRIIYLHVPSASLATTLYVAMTICAIAFIIVRLPIFAMLAQAIAPIGLLYTALCLITGSIWGKLSWGAWWVWDARLTSMLVLFFIYLGYFALNNAFTQRAKAHIATSVLIVVGAIDIPIVKFSVDWWYSLHQPASLIRSGGTSIHPDILHPLLLALTGATLFAAWATFTAFENINLGIQVQRKIKQTH